MIFETFFLRCNFFVTFFLNPKIYQNRKKKNTRLCVCSFHFHPGDADELFCLFYFQSDCWIYHSLMKRKWFSRLHIRSAACSNSRSEVCVSVCVCVAVWTFIGPISLYCVSWKPCCLQSAAKSERKQGAEQILRHTSARSWFKKETKKIC